MSYFEGRWKIKGTVLTPVHIGCDEQLDPFSIAYHDGFLHEFDLAATIAASSSNARASLASRLAGPITTTEQADSIRTLILNETPWSDYVLRKFTVSQEVETSFGQQGVRFIAKTRNAEIQLTSFNRLSGKRFIPGTSLKGALRTAWLDYSAKPDIPVNMTGFKRQDDSEYDTFQKRVLGYRGIEQDPFGALKVSDCHIPETLLTTMDSPSLHRRGRGFRGQGKDPMNFTALLETLDFDSAGPHFEGTMSIVARGAVSRQSAITLEALLKAVQAHTSRTFDAAYRRVELPVLAGEFAEEAVDVMSDWIQSTTGKPNMCVLRIGRFSGFLNLTVEHQRYLPAFRQRGQIVREPATGQHANPVLRPFTSDGRPFGFVKLEFEELPK